MAEFANLNSDRINQWKAGIGLKEAIATLWNTIQPEDQCNISIEIWEIVAQNWQTWAEFGTLFWESCEELKVWETGASEEDAYKRTIKYKTMLPAMHKSFSRTERRKSRSLTVIVENWGPRWNTEFDADSCPGWEHRFPSSPSERFIESLAYLAAEGWDKEQVYFVLGFVSSIRQSLGGGLRRQSEARFIAADVEVAVSELNKMIEETPYPDMTQITYKQLGNYFEEMEIRGLDEAATYCPETVDWTENAAGDGGVGGGLSGKGVWLNGKPPSVEEDIEENVESKCEEEEPKEENEEETEEEDNEEEENEEEENEEDENGEGGVQGENQEGNGETEEEAGDTDETEEEAENPDETDEPEKDFRNTPTPHEVSLNHTSQ